MTYADLYRRTRIQEAVLETLTKEYELAKVQEAKEIPTVKVLDIANIPDKKSYPPRLLIIFVGTALAMVGTVLWLLGTMLWCEIDPKDPGKVFAQEIFSTISSRLPLVARSGATGDLNLRNIWSRMRGPNRDSSDKE